MGLPQGYEQRRDVRMTRDDYNDQSFDPFYFFDYHRLLGFWPRGGEEEFWLPEELADEISMVEHELNGEDVYYITGPPAVYRDYPVMGASALDGALEYWIGSDDYLLRRFEVSGVMCVEEDSAQRLNGWVSLSDFGEPVDIQRPAHEGADDHGNSPANATEILVGETATGSVDSWLDYDYFRFQAEEGRLYYIDVAGSDATLYGPDGVTPAVGRRSQSSGGSETTIMWRAPASDTYYLGVDGPYEGVDDYTVTITLLPEEDDYGNDPSTAHDIGIDESVNGVIGDWDDQDYFKFTANRGQVYRIEVSPHLYGDRPHFVLHSPNGSLREESAGHILWSAPAQGDYYISVEFLYNDSVSSYTLTVASIDDTADDHSDGVANATGLSIGETVGGVLDDEFDVDYFKFSAEEGQGYRVEVGNTFRFSDLTLFAPDAFTPEPLEKYTYSDDDGYGLLWMATEAGTYYLEVKSRWSGAGEYTISVTAVEAVPDDHGDDAETATDISMGETVEGFVDYEFDLDYFRFRANEGQEYMLRVDHQTLGHSLVKVYLADGTTESPPYSARSRLNEGSTYRWIADTSSQYFFSVESESGDLGAYTIVIEPVRG